MPKLVSTSLGILGSGILVALIVVHLYSTQVQFHNSTSTQNIKAIKTGKSRQPSLQPEAFRQAQSLGKRFFDVRAVSTLMGTLKVNGLQQSVTIVRKQQVDGEDVEITLGTSLLSWNKTDGPKVDAKDPNQIEQNLIERLVFDTPDQFVLAQHRGAVYQVIGRQVRPAEAGGGDNYHGALWDIVRIVDVGNERTSRIYYINSETGLIDKIITPQKDKTTTAELSGWAKVAGESIPTQIVWKHETQIVMELKLNTETFN